MSAVVSERHREAAQFVHGYDFGRWRNGEVGDSVVVDMIAQAIADAEQRGAERMQERAAGVADEIEPCDGGCMVAEEVIAAIRALPTEGECG